MTFKVKTFPHFYGVKSGVNIVSKGDLVLLAGKTFHQAEKKISSFPRQLVREETCHECFVDRQMHTRLANKKGGL